MTIFLLDITQKNYSDSPKVLMAFKTSQVLTVRLQLGKA